MRGNLADISAAHKVLFFLLVFLMSYLAANIVVQPLYAIAAGQENNGTALLLCSTVMNIITFVCPALAIHYTMTTDPAGRSAGIRMPLAGNIIIGMTAIMAMSPAANLLQHLCSQMPFPDAMKDMADAIRQWDSSKAESTKLLIGHNMAASIICVGFITGFIEELFFRGTLQRVILSGCRPAVAISISAIIFSLCHMEFSGFLPRIGYGILLGYAYHRTGNLWVPVAMHALNNIVSIVLMHQAAGNQPAGEELTGNSVMLYAASAACLALCVCLTRFFKKEETDKNIAGQEV